MANSDFKEQYRVPEKELDDTFSLIRELNEELKLYYPNNEKESLRTQSLRSGENIYIDLMTLVQTLFMISQFSNNIVDARATMRSKAEESQTRKQERDERIEKEKNGENVDIRDIQAATLVIERVHNSSEFSTYFNNTKIQGLYDERKVNLLLMEETIKFIKKVLSSRELPSDLYRNELTQAEKNEIINQCDFVLANIKRYYNEEETGSNSKRRLPMDQYIIDMCTDLQQIRIQEKKAKLDELIELQTSKIIEEKDEGEKKILQTKLDEYYRVRESVRKAENKNSITNVIEALEGLFFKDEELNLYTDVKKHLISIARRRKLGINEEEESISEEKQLYEYSMAILYSLLKLEFTKEEGYQGVNYNKIRARLHNQLRTYCYCEVGNHKYNNMTYSDLSVLLYQLVELNMALSDKLQYEIIKYQMYNYGILEMIQSALGEDGYNEEEKNKVNGYLAIHYDWDTFEFKVTTDYREKVMTRGTAAYANGRDEHSSEKNKDIKKLSIANHVRSNAEWLKKGQKFKVKDEDKEKLFGRKKKVTETEKYNSELSKKLDLGKELDLSDDNIDAICSNSEARNRFFENVKSNPKFNKRLEAWRTDILKMIPRYYEITYNKEKNVVEITICSEAKNIETLFSQTSIAQEQKEIKKKVKRLVALGLVSNESTKKVVTKEECIKFFSETLPVLRDRIENMQQRDEYEKSEMEEEQQ